MRAGLQAAAVGIPAGYPDYVIHKMVTVMKGGAEVKISKRAGGYVTLRDLIDWTGRDAVRFFMVSRKADTEFVFDVDLALKHNDENPVFYVQYAHARICSVLEQWGGDEAALRDADPSLAHRAERAALMLKLAEYPKLLARAAADLAPHDIAFYLRDLAAAFHSYYVAERFLVEDPALARARLALLAATRQVLRNALDVIGVCAPRENEPDETETRAMKSQRGGFGLGMIVGLLLGLALALAVALYVTKVPVPFINKVPQRTAEQDAAEAERNRPGIPNAPLATKPLPSRRVGAARVRAAPAVTPAAGAATARRARAAPPCARPAASAPPAVSAKPGRRSVHLFRAGRRICPKRGGRTAARQAGDARLHGEGHRARAVGAHRVSGAARPVRQEGRGRRRAGSARRQRRRGGAGARATVAA